MKVTMNLHGGKYAYTDSIAQLRSLLAMYGGREGYFQLDVVLEEGGPAEVHLLMSRRTLYIDAFLNGNNVWCYFNDSKKPSEPRLGIGLNSKFFKLKTDGTHTALQTNTIATKFEPRTPLRLRELLAYKEGASDLGLKLPLSFAVVSCAEAVRFKEAELTVAQLLVGATQSYKPFEDWQTMYKDWEKLSQLNSAKVNVRHAGA